jgi:hypothetical protein
MVIVDPSNADPNDRFGRFSQAVEAQKTSPP